MNKEFRLHIIWYRSLHFIPRHKTRHKVKFKGGSVDGRNKMIIIEKLKISSKKVSKSPSPAKNRSPNLVKKLTHKINLLSSLISGPRISLHQIIHTQAPVKGLQGDKYNQSQYQYDESKIRKCCRLLRMKITLKIWAILKNCAQRLLFWAILTTGSQLLCSTIAFWDNSHQLGPTQLYPLRQVNNDNNSYITIKAQSEQCRKNKKLQCTYIQWCTEWNWKENNSARTYNGAQNAMRCLSTDQGSATCVGQCRALWGHGNQSLRKNLMKMLIVL